MKKFLVVVVCIVALIVSLGLPFRLTSDGLHVALDYPSASVSEVTDDVSMLQVAAYIYERFSDSENGLFFLEVVYNTDTGDYVGLSVSYKNNNGTGVVNLFTPDEVSLEVARKAANLFKPLGFDIFVADDGTLNAIDTIAHFFALLYVSIEFLLMTIFDTFFAAFGLVRGALYLLGF